VKLPLILVDKSFQGTSFLTIYTSSKGVSIGFVGSGFGSGSGSGGIGSA
jgi:hypothetical protein